jgi:L-alanine-DL-glutamate epimerase-like enolase superfamily enzyme
LRLEQRRRTLSFSAAARAAYGTLAERELIEVRVVAADGVTGHGEAAPLEPYDGVSLARCEAALELHAAALAGTEDLAAARAGAASADPLPQAFAAVDLALWDIAARRADVPVAALLSDRPAPTIAVNATITAEDRAGAARQAAGAVAAGFGCVKLKVAVGDDAGRVAAVRAAAGPATLLRLDANGGWSVDQALAAIGALEAAGLELVEEPVHGIEAVRAVRAASAARIAIDETAALPGALESGCADAVCLKLARCGGISGLLAAARTARADGCEIYVASTYDGPVGIAAALHACAALAADGPLAHCGLATLELFSAPPAALLASGGEIAVPVSAGLGAEGFQLAR